MAGGFDLFGPGGPLSEIGKLWRQDQPQAATQAEESKPPLPQIRATCINGVWFVRAEDVADALDRCSSKTNERLITKLRGLANRDS